MKKWCRLIGFGVVFFLFIIQALGKEQVQLNGNILSDSRQEIKVIDSLLIDLSKMDSTICIDGSVVMKFDNDSVFACEWIDVATGDTVSKSKTVTLNPKTTTQYKVNLYYFTGELIPEGDFERNVPFETKYELGHKDWPDCEEREDGKFCGYELYPEGYYCIGKSPSDFHPDFFDFKDHTTGKGNMMVVNGSMSKGIAVWKKRVRVTKGWTYAFSTWGIEVSKEHPATFHFTINKKQLGKNFTLDDLGKYRNTWKQFYELWKADDDYADISLVNLSTDMGGNDFALDDISFASMQLKTGKITVKVLPTVDLGKLADQEVCEGEKIEVNAHASGTGITGYRWSKDGVVLPGSGDRFEVAKATLGDAGEYLCSVTGECGTRKETLRIDVREQLKIEKLRDTVAPCEHSALTFSVNAQGYLPGYRWTPPKKSRGWSNKNKAEYSNSDIVWSRDTGVYTCRVNTVCGDTTFYRVLQDRQKLKITDKPEDIMACEGSEVRVVAGTNRQPSEMSWGKKNMGERIPGNELKFQPVRLEDGGTYKCIALDECGSGDSCNLILRVVPALTTLIVSEDTVVCEHGRAVLRAVADGRMTAYEWSGPSGFKASGSEVVIDPVGPGREGIYVVTATDSCGNRLTDRVKVSFLREYDALAVTGELSVCPGEKISLEVTGGREDMQYAWTTPGGKQRVGAKIEEIAEEGEYRCVVTGTCASVNKKVKVTLKESLQVEPLRESWLLCPGDDVVLRAAASGPEVGYTWWKGEVELETTPELALSGLTTEKTGIYTCKIHSECGDTSLQSRIQLKEPLKIVGHVPDRYVNRNEYLNLFVEVIGDNEREYRWEKDGWAIAGANRNRLNIQVPDCDTLLVYTCQVSGCNTEKAVFYIHVKDYRLLKQDTVVRLCRGQAYSYKIEDTPDGCEARIAWVYNRKDTVSHEQVFTFDRFSQEQAGEYVCYLKSDCGDKEIHLSVEALQEPEITAIYTDLHAVENGIIQVCVGEEVTLKTRVKAEGAVTYEWFRDGKLIEGETSSTLSLNQVTIAQAGAYACHLISADCGEDLENVVLQVNTIPVITASPEMTYCPGQMAKMEVKVVASQPSVFAWQGPQTKDWIAQSDGYTAYYSRAQVNEASEGIYYCQVDNLCGTKTLSFQLNVEKKIGSSEFPRFDTICQGSTVTYRIPEAREGTKYRWTLPDGTQQEARAMQIEHFSAADTGAYTYYIETVNGCFNYSGEIHLALRKELETPVLSPDTAVCEGGKAVFTALADGKDLTYEWLGPKGFYARGNRIEIANVNVLDCGIYEVVVKDVCNRVGKRGRTALALLQEFENIQIDDELFACEGSAVGMSVTGGGGEGLTYEWEHNGQVKGDGVELVIGKVTGQDAGLYVCRIGGTCGSTQKEVVLNIYDRLSAEKEAVLSVCEREDAVLSVKVSGEQPAYRWVRGGKEVGDRSAVLKLYDVIPADTGKYECEVTSVCGDTTLIYDFEIKEKTQIVRHSADRILCEDDAYRLVVEATGENNVYTWKRDGQLLLAEGAVLDEPAWGNSDTLRYTCIVEGDCGVDSATMIIKVGEYRKLTANLEDTLCEGSTYKYNVDFIPEGASVAQKLNYHWTFKDKVIYDGPSSLAPFEQVGPEQEGEYICEVSAVIGSETITKKIYLKINVVRLPQLLSLTPDIFAVEGTRDSIRVMVGGDDLVYRWTKDGEPTGHTESDWNFDPIRFEDKGNYRLHLSNRCSHVEGKVNIEVWRKTVIVYPQERDDSVCRRGGIDLDVIAWGEEGLLYHWYREGKVLDVPLKQPLSIRDAGIMDKGQYVCIVTGRGGADSCKINLDVLKLPEVHIFGEFQLCQDEIGIPRNYWGSSDEQRVDYQWSVVGGEISGNPNVDQVTVSWQAVGADSLILRLTSLKNGCGDQKAVGVHFSPQPEISLVVPERIGYCQDSLILELAYPWGGVFYVNGEETDRVYFKDKSISYVVGYSYTDAVSGCSAYKEDTIRLAGPPRLQLAEDTIRSGWCVPIGIQIKEHSEGEIHWDGDRPLDTTDVMNAVYQATGYTWGDIGFWATLEDEYGCRTADSVVVALIPSPEVVLMNDTLIGSCNELVLTAAFDTLSVSGTRWEPAGTLQVLDHYHARIVGKETGNNRYTLAVTDFYGCVSSDTVEVFVEKAPELESREICVGDSLRIETATFSGYEWSDGFEGNGRILKEAGNYQLGVKDRYGCRGEAGYTVRPLPVVNLRDTAIYEGQEMEYIVEDEGDYGPYRYRWQDGSRQNSFLAKTAGWYRVVVTDELGCQASDSAFLEIRKWYIAAPDAFLPGSSGQNSRFYLKEVNFGSRFEMYIYDRWGELLFKTNEIGFHGGWDGSFKGTKCQPGAYVWVAFVDGKEVGRGTLMLIK